MTSAFREMVLPEICSDEPMDWKDMAGPDLRMAPGSDPKSAFVCPFCEGKDGFSQNKVGERSSAAGKLLINSTMKCLNCGNWSYLTYEIGGPYCQFVLYPTRPKEDEAHRSWPPHTATYFIQAKRALRTASWDAAAIMSRTVLQSIMRDFGAEGGGLNAKINDLARKGLIVSALQDWAQHIRLIANDVVHPDPTKATATEEDARDLVRFTEYFLHYVYTIPWEIAEQKNRAKPAVPSTP